MGHFEAMQDLVDESAPAVKPPPEMHYKAKDEEATRGSIRCYPSLHLMNPFDPKQEDIFIEDIAHHLALCNRYAGASPEPLSVAEHSVRVMERMANSGVTKKEHLLVALLHDCEEAYFLDMPSPIKRAPYMHRYAQAAKSLRRVILSKYHLDNAVMKHVKAFDDEEYYRERREMWPVDPKDYVAPWPWRTAEWNFLDAFSTLNSGR